MRCLLPRVPSVPPGVSWLLLRAVALFVCGLSYVRGPRLRPVRFVSACLCVLGLSLVRCALRAGVRIACLACSLSVLWTLSKLVLPAGRGAWHLSSAVVVTRGQPLFMRRSSSGPVAFGAPVRFSVAV